MADFDLAYSPMIKNEGGYVNHTVKGDRGGQTYAGIARAYHPNWPGWIHIDNGDVDNPALTSLVKSFYKTEFWDRIKGDDITHQQVAFVIFDFAVNAGYRTSAKIAQIIVECEPDGLVGNNTLSKLNAINEEEFVLKFTLAKVARYAEICNNNKSQSKFLLGWINRSLRSVS